MARLRTFIALDLGKQLRDRLIALQEQLARTGKEVKWVEADNIHLTLLFLGEVDERAVIDVCRAVGAVAAAHQPFPLSVEGVGCFPNLRRPRIFWAGVSAGRQAVIDLHDRLEEPLLDLGCYRREERQYTPHVTLGRLKGDEAPEKLVTAVARQQGWKGGETTIGDVCVMSSELTRDGPIYTVLSRAPLG
jgi:2'-5' RNA ligase